MAPDDFARRGDARRAGVGDPPLASEALLAAAVLADALPFCDLSRLLDWTEACEATPCGR
jgi:hypothetical protein